MSKLQNIRETTLEIEGVVAYEINRNRGSIGVDFTFTLPRIDRDLVVGDRIIFKGIEGIVTSKNLQASPEGWRTVIGGVSAIGDLTRKAPIKTLTFMSMTPAERYDFDIACKSDYSSLDYEPLIKICDPETFTGGWTSQEVINEIALRAELPIVCNVYSYWVKQVQVSNSNSYFDAILSLVNFLKPIIHDQDGVIYLVERPLSAGSILLSKMVQVGQNQAFNYESQAEYFSVEGGYGQWNREKSKVKADPERETIFESETYQEKPQLMTVIIRGAKPVVDKVSGTTTYETVGENYVPGPGEGPVVQASYSYWLKEPMREKQTTTEVYLLDPYGNFKAILSRHTIGMNLTLKAKVLDSLEEYTYDFLTEAFDRPRLKAKKTTTGRYTWRVSEGLVNSRSYAGKVEEVSESWAYATNGTLLQETLTRSMDCVKLAGSEDWAALDVADKMYRREGSTETVDIERMVVEEKVTKYRQVTPVLYQRAITIRKLGPLSRVKGQENYITTTEMVRGTVPREPIRYRTMQVYCDNLEDAEGTTRVPVVTLSNPNIIDWVDACQILARSMRQAAEGNVVERTLVIPGWVPVDVGWEIDVGSLPIGRAETIPEIPIANFAEITSYSRTKRAGSVSENTTITVEVR